MTKQRISLATILLLSAVVAVQAQTQTQYDKGTPPQYAVGVSSFGSYVSTDLGTINLTNGSLNFKIPLGTMGGRGGLSIPVSLNYSSKVWSASMDTDIERESGSPQSVAFADYDRGLLEGGNWQSIIGAGWSIGGWPGLDAKRVLIGRIPSGPNAGCYNYIVTKLTLYLPDRGEIELRDDATDGAPLATDCSATALSRGTRWHATDGSGIIFINDVDNGVAQWPANLSGVVITADGTRIRVGSGGEMIDRNGNKIGATDQLGRTFTVQHNVPDPENPSVTLAVLVTIPGYQGQNRYYKIKTGIMNENYRAGINPALPVITGDWDPEQWGYDWGSPTRLFLKSYGLYAQRIDVLEVLNELVLPDGRSLKFKYNEFGEVAEVQLPTGGKIQYDHAYRSGLPSGNSPNWETGTNGAGSGIATDVKWVDRAVTQKRTYPDGSTLEGTWTYGFSPSSSSVTVTSASGDLLLDTRHYFLTGGRYTNYSNWPYGYDGTHYTLWSTGIEWRTEARDASGAIISAVEQDWTQRAPVSWSGYPQEQPANDNRVNQVRKYLQTGAFAKVESEYDAFNNPIEVREYDFDQSLKRQTITSYSSTNLVNGTSYAADSIHLLGLPLQQSIYDEAGVEVARSFYEYDVYAADGNHDALLAYPSITGHDTANYGPGRTTRGNVTQVANWIKATDSYLYTHPRYDIAGNVVSTKDDRGNVTTISFADDFGNGSNPGAGSPGAFGATYALPTLVTSPPPQPGQPQHTTRSQYDFWTGLPTGFKDRNGIVAQTTYDDPFNRPTLTIAALGVNGVERRAAMYYAFLANPYGITLTNNDVLTAKDQNTTGDGVLRAWTKTDGFGRTIEAWSKDPQGDVQVATIFDALGRSKQVSNPYRPALGEMPTYTTTEYDLAGRVVLVTTPDNASVRTAYSGSRVLVADQNTSDDLRRKRISETDALGRLRTVWEVTAADQYTEGVSFPNWPSVTNAYKTTYQYDALDNLTQVSQGGQTRTFVYDSLKRLISATNPESGNVIYLYDNNGNLLVKADARGVSSHYDYDSLNRVTRRWYNGSASLAETTHNSPALPSGVGSSDEVKYFYDSQSLPGGAPTLDREFATGRLVAMTYGGGSAGDYYGFDALGRPKLKIQQTGGINYQTTAIHNLAGAITSMSYPSGHSVTNSYDSAGRLQSFTGYLGDGTQRTYASGISYSSFGGMTQEQFGTNTPLFNKKHYNTRGQLYDVRVSTASMSSDEWNYNRGALSFYYGYGWGQSGPSNNGNLTKQQHFAPLNDAVTDRAYTEDIYTYDALNRLTSVTEAHGGMGAVGSPDFVQAYNYDRWGNRTIDQVSTSPNVPKPNFGVDPSNNRLTAPAGYTMGYDQAGNLTNDTFTGEGARTYDAENRMTGSAGSLPATYSYDGDGRRVKRVVNGTETWQVYGLGGELLAEYAANANASSPQKEYGYRNGELLVTAEAGSGTGSYNAVSQFSSTQDPAGAWTYGYRNTGGSFSAYTSLNHTWGTALDDWTRGDGGCCPTVVHINNGTSQSYASGVVQPAEMLNLHPGQSGERSVVRWTAPAAGTYQIAGRFEGIDTRGTTSDVSITQNGTSVFTANVSGYGTQLPFSVTRTVAAGETIEFTVGWGSNGEFSYDSTGLAVTIGLVTAYNPVSEFSTTQNPAGAWTYGYRNTGGSFSAYTSLNHTWGTALDDWTRGDGGCCPTVVHINNGTSQSYASGVVQPADMLNLHPGQSGERSVVRWTAPAAGTYQIAGRFEGIDTRGTTSDVSITQNGTSVFTANLSGYGTQLPFSLTRTVAVGETIEFTVGWGSNGEFSYDSTGLAVGVTQSSGGDGGSLANIRWLVADQLGTPRMVFDETGSLANVSRHDYLPFGEELYSGSGGRSTAQGYTGDNVRQKFTGYEHDPETGLEFAQARYYSSVQGRFASTDPIMISQDRVESPQALNLYVYTRNNPLKYVDPNGEEIVYDPTLSDKHKKPIQESIATLRSQSKSADKAFGVFDKPAGEGPDLHIGVLDDETFTRQKGVPNKALAYTTNEGGVLDGSGGNYLVSHSRINFRESSLSESNLEQEGRDRAQGRETLIEGILSHEIGHARDNALDRKGFDLRQEQDKNLKYHDRRNEIRADDTLGATRAERFFGGHVRGDSFQSGLKFPRKEIRILRQ